MFYYSADRHDTRRNPVVVQLSPAGCYCAQTLYRLYRVVASLLLASLWICQLVLCGRFGFTSYASTIMP